MPAALESGKELCRRATPRHIKIAQNHKWFLQCGGLAFPRSSIFCFSILLICSRLLNLSSTLSQPPLLVRDGSNPPAFRSPAPAQLRDWYPPTSPAPPPEPLLALTRCHPSAQPSRPKGCGSQPRVLLQSDGHRLDLRIPNLHGPSHIPRDRVPTGAQ